MKAQLFFGCVFLMCLCVLDGVPSGVTFAWTIETVDSSANSGPSSDIAIDSLGNPHISYYDQTTYDLKYARSDGSGWQIERLDSDYDVGATTSIALDSNDYPHISYFDWSNSSLKYAYQDAGGWHITTIASGGSIGDHSSIDVDSQNRPHIAYTDGPYQVLYCFFSETGWQYELIEQNLDGWGGECAMALDSNDNANVCYFHGFSPDFGTLKYAYRAQTGWEITSIDTNLGDVGGHLSIAVDFFLNPHISYFDFTNGQLKYAVWAGYWQIEIVDTISDWTGEYTSIAIDEFDRPHISYHENFEGDLRYAWKDLSGWHLEPIDTENNAGVSTSIAIRNNSVDVSYYSVAESTGVLKYAHRSTGPTPTPSPPPCIQTGVDVSMPASMFHTGDHCSCTAIVCNAEGSTISGNPLFVILDVYGSYYFAPSFNTTFDHYLTHYPTFPVGTTTVTVIPDFTWPVDTGSANGLIWYAALTNPEMTALFGTMDSFSFGWSE